MAHQVFPTQIEQPRLRFFGLFTPGFKGGSLMNVGRNFAVVKVKQLLVIDQHVLSARLVLQLLDFGDQTFIGTKKCRAAIELAMRQGLAYENLTRFFAVNGAVMHPAFRDNG